MQSLVLNLPQTNLAALRWGEGNRRKVLAIHGWLDNAASFQFLAPKLAEQGFDVVAIDLPGHGQSEHRPPGCSYHLVDYLKDLAQTIECLEWNAPVLLGHSLGSIICSMFAAAAPHQCSKLVMIDGIGPMSDPVGKTASNLKSALASALRPVSEKRPYYTIEKAVEDRQRGFGGLSRKASEILVDRNLVKEKRGWVWRTDSRLRRSSFVRFTEEQVHQYLSAIEQPVLLIQANKGFVKEGPGVDARKQCFKDLHTVTHDGGHHLHMDGDVAGLAASIADFL